MTDPHRTQAPGVLSQLLGDQNRRWQQGERILVETYLAQHPELHARQEWLLSLIFNEVCLRAQAGEQPGFSGIPAALSPPGNTAAPTIRGPIRAGFGAGWPVR